MVICKTVSSLLSCLSHRSPGPRVGFVPTMGALHDGHASLIREARAGGRFTVCSIFVNPTQFNDPSDFAKYPKTLDQDIRLLEQNGTDLLFLPGVEDIYPDGTAPGKYYELGYLETILEGRYRPGHFQGVCQVVERLLRIVNPDDLYLGQKDFQQCMVIRKMIESEKLPVSLIICPTRREEDGLAMSSRNLRLDAARREGAVALHQVLDAIRIRCAKGLGAGTDHRSLALDPIKAEGRAALESLGFLVDYVDIATADDLHLLETWDGSAPAVALVAAFSGDVRLIDNEMLNLS